MKAIKFVLLALVAMLVVGGGPRRVAAVEVEYNGGPVRREVIAIFDARHEGEAATSRIHHFVEMPLNWLGFTVTYVDVNGALPTPEEVSRAAGVVSWLIEPMAEPGRYLNWLDEATRAGTRLVVFSELAPGVQSSFDDVAGRVLGRIGLAPTPDHISVTHRAKITVHTQDIVGFERPVDKASPDFRVLTLASPAATAHVTAQVPSRAGKPDAVLIATGPGGGYVTDEYSTVFEANTDRVRWVLNPFVFLKLALAKERMPVPDVTTLSGRRIYFSHIDGDGWNNVSYIDGYRQAQITSADVVRKEAIEPFPDLPVTVGVIAGDMIPALGGNLAARETARKLYALPQVEVGSHTYSHPFDWKFFEAYTRPAEEALIDKVRSPELSAYERVRRAVASVAGIETPLDVSARYVAGSSDLPRTYLKDAFDLDKEVRGALTFSESLAPAGKRARLYQWSGDCLPFEKAIKATRRAGVRNMNGGDSRLDAEFPSVFYVPPIARPVGKERQIYAGNSNENTYTNDWTGPYYGYSLLADTVRNTETPRRLKPFNVYYHMYSGERESALAALKQNLTLARQSALVPIPASQYAAIADDFFAVSINRLDTLSWSVTERGALQTVRFDDADTLVVDQGRSLGVLGFTRHAGGVMYVALDPAIDAAVVTLKPLAEADGTAQVPVPAPVAGASLISSRWQFRQYEAQGCAFSVTAEGFGAGEMLWQTAPGRKYEIVAEREGQEVARLPVVADASGIVNATLKVDAITPLRLRFTCNE